MLLGLAGEAQAWSYYTCDGSRLHWNGERANMVLGSQFPAGSIGDSRLQAAMWQWNHVNSRFTFYVGHGTFSTTGRNSRNEVVISSEASDGPGDTLATTKIHYHCDWDIINGWEFGIDETDVVFDAAENWSYDDLDGSDSSTNFELVALHELGHVLGLEHEDDVLATMNSRHPHGGPLGSNHEVAPLPDDRAGARALYGGSGTANDVAASAFQRIGGGRSGVISVPLEISRGQTYGLQYTVGNLGTSNQSFSVDFFLSTNRTISFTDIYLGSTYISGGGGGIGTLPVSLTIPEVLPTYTDYYFGFIVDGTEAIAESNETNNAQHFPQPVKVAPACRDGVDNDFDGLVDFPADPDCSDESYDDSEVAACSNGSDDDFDWLTDYPNDPGCTSPNDDWEREPGLVCDDGEDNDGDFVVDANDVGCRSSDSGTESPECNDGIDNDGDGRLDFDGGAWFDWDGNGYIDVWFNPTTPAVGVADPQCFEVWAPWADSEALPEPDAILSLVSGIALLALLARRRTRTAGLRPAHFVRVGGRASARG
jgi:hypothetical protein